MAGGAAAARKGLSGRRLATVGKHAVALVVAVVCIWAIANALKGQSLASIAEAFGSIRVSALATAVTLVATNYVVMWGMEMLAMRDAGVVLPFARAGISAFVGNALSVAAGLGPISGASVRAGLFVRWGVPVYAAAIVAMTVTLMSLTGGAALAAIGLVLQPDGVADMLNTPPTLVRGVGVVFLLTVLAMLVIIGPTRFVVTLLGARVSVPSAGGALLRIGLGALDWWISANVFYAITSSVHGWAPLSFATTFASAHFAGMAVGAPAGLGVFDAIFLQLGVGHMAPAHVAAALLLYRLVGYAAPALIALGPYLAISNRNSSGS